MDSGSVSIEAFRFLDVRAPKMASSTNRAYVIDRALLDFPESDFERQLRTLKREGDYLGALSAAVTAGAFSFSASALSSGFVRDVSEYEQALLARQVAPDAVLANLKELYAKRRGAQTDELYLVAPAAQLWDLYLGALIVTMTGQQLEDAFLAQLSAGLRIAGALYAARRAGAEVELDVRSYATASIAVGSASIETAAISKSKPKIERTSADATARLLQDDLVRGLLELELASQELNNVLVTREMTITPSAPVAPGTSTGKDILVTRPAVALVVSIPKTALSASTQKMLRDSFGATDSLNSVDNVSLLEVVPKVDRALAGAGSQVFSATSVSTIKSLGEQFSLFRRELATTGAISADRLRALPLVIAPSSCNRPVSLNIGGEASVRPLGIGDLKVVKQSLLRYDPGEVAHVENVLEGQQKERVHSVKQRTEETITIEQERSTSTEKDLQTTDRFELSDETNQTISDRRQNEFGVTVSASYGAVSISANTKFSDSSSREQSTKIARQFAREVVNRSVEKVQQRVREERIRKSTLEIEETNKYALTAAGKNVVGIYRWIDKIYWAQVHVYGKRLMLEFMVPEPAALYLHNQTIKPDDAGGLSAPEPLSITADQITRSNYAAFASKYSAEVESPPPSIRQAKFVARNSSDTSKTAITLDDGWEGISAVPAASWTYVSGTPAQLRVHIGSELWDSNEAWGHRFLEDGASGEIPLTVTPLYISSFNVTATVVCAPSDFLFRQWQLNTYKALVTAYRLRLTEYQEYLASKKSAEVALQVRPDQENRGIEQRELQRACIEILSLQHLDQFGSIEENQQTGWPEIDFAAAKAQGDYALFFQHSFEWEQMTYVFYPYFWARQNQWSKKLAADGGDALFSRFLTAGFARVVVPVRPAHESDVLYFLETGTQFHGTEPPVLGDPRYVDIIDEIKESLDAPDAGIPEGDPWQFKIPTSLVILEDGGKLPEWALSMPSATSFVPSKDMCAGIPYNAAQWKDAKTIAEAIRKLGYAIDTAGDQNEVIRRSRGAVRAMQIRFNELGVDALIGRRLVVDGIVGACTLRALTYFDALRVAGKWPGVS